MGLQLLLLVACVIAASGIVLHERATFLKHLTDRLGRPATFVSFMPLQSYERVSFHKLLASDRLVAEQPTDDFSGIIINEHDVYVADFNANSTYNVLFQAKDFLKAPARWVIFYSIDNEEVIKHYDNSDCNDIIEMGKRNVEKRFNELHVGVDTEVYIAFEGGSREHVFLFHQISPKLKCIWEEYAIWTKDESFDRPPPNQTLTFRRRNIQGRKVVATAIITDAGTPDDMKDFRRPTVDAEAKLTYYLVFHLFEWLNASGHINGTNTWGFLQPDGTYDGVMGELQHGRSELASIRLYVSLKRMEVVEYVMSPFSERDGLSLPTFILMKPSLATITNIYALPFTGGVWLCLIFLLILSSVLLYLATFKEIKVNKLTDKRWHQRLSQCFHDVISLVFQQGTASDPVSVCSRQIILLGLMSFMFLYTAYSAKVVALLQSTTNEIDSIEALLKSPVQIGAHNVSFNKHFFKDDNRPVHRELYLKKVQPQGEGFYVSLEEGIQRVKQGLYAFHAQANLCLDLIQRTFLEHEKCNLAFVKFMPSSDPHFVVWKKSDIKEQLRIGAFHIRESGLLARAVRRFVSSPKCDASTGIFTAVSLLQVAPAFKCLLMIYGCAVAILVAEILYKRNAGRVFKNC